MWFYTHDSFALVIGVVRKQDDVGGVCAVGSCGVSRNRVVTVQMFLVPKSSRAYRPIVAIYGRVFNRRAICLRAGPFGDSFANFST